ncbi:MAG: hypothetical protein HC887_02935 [Desulfobacteraceae bacterium]|nr:hypothetical protein [Desulfobacteraceae bacterium]
MDTIGEAVSFYSAYNFGLVWENTTNSLYSRSVDADNPAGSGYWQAGGGNADVLALSYIYKLSNHLHCRL